MPEVSEAARKAAEEIYKSTSLCSGEACWAEECPHEECTNCMHKIAAIIERYMQEEWKFESIPTGRRVLVAAEYHDGYPNRVGIGEVYIEDGKKEIQVDDGVERLALELPLTVYAWQELPAPPPNIKKEAAPCPEK